MTKIKKYIIILILTLTGLYILTLLVALRAQRTIHIKYGTDFNDERIELGLYPIGDFQDIDNEYWSNLYPYDPIKRWTEILTNTEIANVTNYSNPDKGNMPFHNEKTIIYGTHLFFWQNFLAGEFDVFIKPLDNEEDIYLYVIYISEDVSEDFDLARGNYFFANLDTIHKGSFDPLCGDIYEDEKDFGNDITKGNITKEQADKLLTEWRLK